MKESFQEQLKLLQELQDIDLTLHKCRIDIERLPERVAEAKAARDAAKAELDAATGERDAVEKQRREDEQNLADSTEHLREREAKLYAIKTQKEYQAAIKEISEGKRLNREREDRILKAMECLENLGTNITQLETTFADKEQAYASQQAEVDAEEERIRKLMADDEAKRPELVAKIDPKLLRKYDFIRQRYAEALSPVVDGVCQGCSRRVTPQIFNEMLRREELKVCASCQRLIYVPDQPEREEACETPGEEAS